MTSRFLALFFAASLLFGCKAGDDRLTGAGVTFVVPLQTSQADHGSSGIDYRSDTFNASTDGRTLRVDGKLYGAVKAGDVVDFTERGVVKVNGVVRRAEGP